MSNLGGLVGPEQRCEHGEGDDRANADERHDSDRGSESLPPVTQRRTSHVSRIVERGSITPSAMSTAKLITRTSVPKSSATPCTAG